MEESRHSYLEDNSRHSGTNCNSHQDRHSNHFDGGSGIFGASEIGQHFTCETAQGNSVSKF